MNNILGYGQTEYIDCSLHWFGHDNEELYKYNLKTNRYKLSMYGWLNSESAITYQFNQWGFRTPEFESTGGIMFLGCSHVVGIGLPDQYTFSRLVSDELGLEMYRLGVGAGSNDTAFRIADYWIPQLKPKYVVLLETHRGRMEIVNSDRFSRIRPGVDNKYTSSQYYKDFISNDHNIELLRKKNLFGIEHICREHSAVFVTLDVEGYMFSNIAQCDQARDLMHVGKKGNEVIANEFVRLIKNVQSV